MSLTVNDLPGEMEAWGMPLEALKGSRDHMRVHIFVRGAAARDTALCGALMVDPRALFGESDVVCSRCLRAAGIA